MTNDENRGLERGTRPGALTRQGTGNLVSRGLADLELTERESKAGGVPAEESYERGLRLLRNDRYAEAMTWFRWAADQGYAAAQSALGNMYDNGQGVPQDYVEAVLWYRRAADQEHAAAQYILGFMYDRGRGVPQDDVEAARLYRLAADQGDADAQANLGVMYEFGRGVPQDDVVAHMWFDLSAALSGEARSRSAQARDEVAGRMTADQVAEAQRRAREWTPTNQPR